MLKHIIEAYSQEVADPAKYSLCESGTVRGSSWRRFQSKSRLASAFLRSERVDIYTCKRGGDVSRGGNAEARRSGGVKKSSSNCFNILNGTGIQWR